VKRSSSSGFTLVEVLVAVVALMIVIGSIYGAFRTANMSVSRAEERVDVFQTARVLLAQINAELCSAYQPSGQEESALVGEDTQGSETGSQYDKLTFLTTARRSASRSDPAGDVCKVSYTVETTSDDEPMGLFVQEDFQPGLSSPDARREPVRLSDRVIAFNCKYLDPDSDEWRNDWTQQTKLPKAVRVELSLKPEREGAKPITVASTANLMIDSGPGAETAIGEEEEDAGQ